MTDADVRHGEGEAVRREAWDWVLRLTSGDATPVDVAELERWCARSPLHAEAFARASGRWRTFGPAIANVAQRGQLALSAPPQRAPLRVGRRAFLGGLLAASAAGAAIAVVQPPLGLWPSAGEFAADYRTAPGEQRQLVVAENLSVEMNTRTSLNVRAAGPERDRIELISGEAAIATRARPVEVIAGSGVLTADRASFNVRADGVNVCVTCLEGIVVLTQGGPSVSLGKDQQITYAAHGFGAPATVDVGIVTGWRDGDLYFQNEPLAHVIDEINRYRSGKILLVNRELGHRRFTAHFKLARIDAVVGQLQAAFGARVTPLPGGIVLVS